MEKAIQTPNEKTAITIIDLAHYNIPNSIEIKSHLEEELGELVSISKNLSFLVASRHLTSRKVLEGLDKEFQIIEMGSGFSPHGINFEEKFEKYIEIDLPFNSELKSKIISKIKSKNKILFISGNIFEKETWKNVANSLDSKKPVFIFCEGVVSHYANKEQKDKLSKYLKSILVHEKSMFYLDDTFKNHPELNKNEIVSAGKSDLAKKFNKTAYPGMKDRTLLTERKDWEERGFKFLKEIDYENIEGYEEILSKLRGNIFKLINHKLNI